jgi:hypothetical protein
MRLRERTVLGRLAFWLWIVAGLLAIVVVDGLIGRYG